MIEEIKQVTCDGCKTVVQGQLTIPETWVLVQISCHPRLNTVNNYHLCQKCKKQLPFKMKAPDENPKAS